MAQITAISENAVTVVLGNEIDPDTHAQVLAFSHLLQNEPCPGLQSVVPAFASVTVFFDPVEAANCPPVQGSVVRAVEAYLAEKLRRLPESALAAIPHVRQVEIPVRYDGPDLPEVARRLGLTQEEVVDIHTRHWYTVFMIGFLPGFPYLGPLPDALVLPRRHTPRLRVPAGSVAIAGHQTGIYPQESPGGWHLIGRTEYPLFDPFQSPPAQLKAGWLVRFVRIS
jgi:inhibitor of KinA